MSWAAARSATVSGPPPALASSARARTAYSARAEISTPRVWLAATVTVGSTGTARPAAAATGGQAATLTPQPESSADGREPVTQQFGDVSVDIGDDFVALVEIHRPPGNFFDVKLIRSLAEAYAALDADPSCRAIVLASEGKHFCAGADFSAQSQAEALPEEGAASLYREAVRLFRAETPVVAAVQGAAVGGGLGLACSADFRVAAPEARFAANFAQLGFHHGFGLTVTLPLIVGHQRALELLYLGRRISGEEAHRIGLCDRLVPAGRGPDRGQGAGRRDRHLRPAGDPVHPPDHAGPPRRRGGGGDRPRGRRADPPADDQRLRRGSPGHGRAAAAPLHRPVAERRTARKRAQWMRW